MLVGQDAGLGREGASVVVSLIYNDSALESEMTDLAERYTYSRRSSGVCLWQRVKKSIQAFSLGFLN